MTSDTNNTGHYPDDSVEAIFALVKRPPGVSREQHRRDPEMTYRHYAIQTLFLRMGRCDPGVDRLRQQFTAGKLSAEEFINRVGWRAN